jgi:hypothetical protein
MPIVLFVIGSPQREGAIRLARRPKQRTASNEVAWFRPQSAFVADQSRRFQGLLAFGSSVRPVAR